MSRIASREPSVPRLTASLSRSDLLWVANTAHGPGGHWHARVRGDEPDHDHLATAEAAVRYLADHRVPVPDGPPDGAALAQMRVLRVQVRTMLGADAAAADPWTGDCLALLADATFSLDCDGRIGNTQAGWPGFCRDLLVPLIGLVQDRVALRCCANPACRLVFEDGSRNHARRWCDTKGCGNRDRVRRARRREAELPARMPGA